MSDSVNLEQELKLQAPRSFDLSVLADGVNGLTASPMESKRVSTIYYDTDDLRLTRWGTCLRFRRGEGWMVKLGTDRYNGALIRTEHRFDGPSTRPPKAALELLGAFLRGRAVHPVAKLRTVRKTVHLHGGAGEPLVEVADDDVRVLGDGRVVDRFRQVEVELLDGAPTALLDSLKSSLQHAGAGPIDPMPKNVRALGAAALEPAELHVSPPDAHSSVADVIRASLSASVEQLLRSDAPLRLNMDAETVHQARVATRKLRSDLRTFEPLLREEWARVLRSKIKWLSKQLGAVRDADVLLARLRRRASALSESDAKAAETVIARFAKECGATRKSLAKLLKEQRYVALLDQLVDAAAEPRFEQSATAQAIDVLPRLVEKPWRKLNKAVNELTDKPDDDQLHRIRIKAKHCRYAVEAVIPVAGKPAERFASKVQKLQKVLGELHDGGVVAKRLREIDGPRADIFIAGELAGMEGRAAAKARDGWRKAWEKASKKSLRSWMD